MAADPVPAAAVALLQYLDELIDQRGRRFSGTHRDHAPTASDPLVVLVIDELAMVTAYVTDPELRKDATRLLTRILTRGRALGVVVVGFAQDPRKETIPARGLFTQIVALRLRSREEVAMVLGEGAAKLAPAHRISLGAPDGGYLVAEDGDIVQVRADY